MIATSAGTRAGQVASSVKISAWAFALCLVIFAELVALGANGDFLAVAAAVLELAVSTALIVSLGSDDFFRSTRWFLAASAALIAWSALPLLSSVGLSLPFDLSRDAVVAPDLLVPSIVRLAGALGLLLAGTVIGDLEGSPKRVMSSLAALGLLQIVIGLALRQYDPEHVWGTQRPLNILRFSGTMTNANADSCVAAVIAVIAFAKLQTLSANRLRRLPTNADWLMRAVCVLAAIGGLGVCLISGSRAPLILGAFAVGCLIFADLSAARTARSRLLILVPLFVAIIMFGLVDSRTIERMSNLSVDGLDRLSLWQHYLGLVRGMPITGYGLRSFGPLNVQTLSNPADAEHLWFVNSAHNFVIEAILEGGWIFCSVGSVILVLIAKDIVRARRSIWSDPLGRGVCASLVVIILCAMVDIALDVPAIVGLLLLLAGTLWGCSIRAIATH